MPSRAARSDSWLETTAKCCAVRSGRSADGADHRLLIGGRRERRRDGDRPRRRAQRRNVVLGLHVRVRVEPQRVGERRELHVLVGLRLHHRDARLRRRQLRGRQIGARLGAGANLRRDERFLHQVELHGRQRDLRLPLGGERVVVRGRDVEGDGLQLPLVGRDRGRLRRPRARGSARRRGRRRRSAAAARSTGRSTSCIGAALHPDRRRRAGDRIGHGDRCCFFRPAACSARARRDPGDRGEQRALREPDRRGRDRDVGPRRREHRRARVRDQDRLLQRDHLRHAGDRRPAPTPAPAFRRPETAAARPDRPAPRSGSSSGWSAPSRRWGRGSRGRRARPAPACRPRRATRSASGRARSRRAPA